ncbi:MAG: cupredoxin domain-containing protein [Candidatus Levyibacteriota bacterium]
MEDHQETPETPQIQKGNGKILLAVGIIAFIALVGVVALSLKTTNKSLSANSMREEMTESSSEAKAEAKNAVAGAQTDQTPNEVTVQMEAGSFYYKPAQIKVKKGTKVKIVMTSHDMMHNFNIDELQVKMPLTKAGETNTVEFTADKAGTFEYYCSVGKHRLMGQVGQLIVE